MIGDDASADKMELGTEPTEQEISLTINFTFAQFKEHLSKELRENRKEIAADNERSIAKLATDLESTKQELGQYKKENGAEMQKIREQLQNLSKQSSTGREVRELVAKEVEKRTVGPTMNVTEQERRSYWWSRRCFKVWPVDGENKEEIMKFLELFMRTKLKIPTGVVDKKDIVDVHRCRLGRNQVQGRGTGGVWRRRVM